MQLEVGAILEGKITGITKFGAFVDLGEGKSGLVHISEISGSYVKEVSDHVKEGQNVKVKVLSLNNKGKIELSIRQADENFVSKKTYSPNDNRSKQEKSVPSFEDMINKFKKMSDEKLSGLKSKPESRRPRNFHKNNNV